MTKPGEGYDALHRMSKEKVFAKRVKAAVNVAAFVHAPWSSVLDVSAGENSIEIMMTSDFPDDSRVNFKSLVACLHNLLGVPVSIDVFTKTKEFVSPLP